MNPQNIKNKYAGFSLMEMLIAIFVFSLITTTVVGTFVKVVSVSKKARALQQDTEQARFAIEQMSKTLRTSTILSVTAARIEAFDYSQGECTQYDFSSASHKLRTMVGTWTNSATPDVTPTCAFGGAYVDMISNSLNSVSFAFVKPLTAPVGRITISLHVCYNNICTGNAGDEVVIQSTVSLRDYEEVSP